MRVPITTLMLRNVPQKYTQDVLLKEVQDVIGSEVPFNFFYLPWDSRNKCSVGYAFINCCEAAAADRCRVLFNEYFFRRSAKRKACNVFAAHIQGLENNLLHLMPTALAESRAHCPVVVWQGHELKLQRVITALHHLWSSNVPSGQRPMPASEPQLARPASCGDHRQTPAFAASLGGTPASGDAAGKSTSTGLASPRAPSTRGSHRETLCSNSTEGVAGSSGAAADDAFGRSLAEVSLAERLQAAALAKCTPLPPQVLDGLAGPQPADMFASEGSDAGGGLAGIAPAAAAATAPAWRPREGGPWPPCEGPKVIVTPTSRDVNSRALARFFDMCDAEVNQHHLHQQRHHQEQQVQQQQMRQQLQQLQQHRQAGLCFDARAQSTGAVWSV